MSEGRLDPPTTETSRASNWAKFLHLLVNTAVASLTSNFLWFALVFWVYLETRSILATGVLGGVYMLLLAMSSMYFGSLVDRYRKLVVMRASAWITLTTFVLATIMFFTVPHDALLTVSGLWFWVFSLVILAGCVVEQMRNLALATTVTLLIDEPRRANANGLVGTVQGITFLVTSVFSGLSVGLLGMGPTILIAMACTIAPMIHLYILRVNEPEIVRDPEFRAIDFRGGWRAILGVPGLLALVLFSTFNNLTGGVFMALLDPYGLTLFEVEIWGLVLGLTSVGMILGGLIVARTGLGKNPIRTLLLLVAVTGVIGIFFGLREWPWLLISGIFLFMTVIPAIEASEQTVIQKVVPFERQGRVFGFAATFEAATAPITAFIIAPIAEFIVVPYMQSPAGAAQWQWLLGTGEARGMALIFVIAGLLSLLLALGAMLTRSYRKLSQSYSDAESTHPVGS
ncbi:MFS transporter [Leucobacter denitrificans]|uniref:MFS transporter n=1 Tax=Leucobacter denitrificans TaxID=683042 RepID=A0A7G9S622_9MICO|nr:MFS transporter [Leucobacter denitrificans]QNN63297.1 MFS transporter [Leucobacter denitrificans]